MTPTRRQFLKNTAGASALFSLGSGLAGPHACHAAAESAPPPGDQRVLIVVQLTGGNDGLNTVVPFRDDAYAQHRTTLRLTEDEVHPISDTLGLHPQMDGMARLYRDGHLSIIQGVGYTPPNDNHEVSMRIWQTADLDAEHRDTGWLGRALDQLAAQQPSALPGVFVSNIRPPLTLASARTVVPRIRSLDDFRLDGPAAARSIEASAPGATESTNHLLDHARSVSRTAQTHHELIAKQTRRMAQRDEPEYPPMALAANLRTIADLIEADLGIRVFYTELGGDGFGGFDNHAGQAPNHAALLRQLSESLAALVDDLARRELLDRVLLMTFSEFGRTLAENGRRGTGHGAAAPVFLVGGRLETPLVGEHPSLTDLVNGSPRPHTDFRRVYATVLNTWLQLDSDVVLGRSFEPIDCLRV